MGALRIMTFNLRRDVDHDAENRWSERRDRVAAIVRDHAPDVLGTQEGLPHQLADLDARLDGYERIGGCRRGDATDEACSIFYATGRLRALAWGDLWLSDTPGVAGSATWGNRLPRIVTWARFQDKATGREFTVANTHLDHESEEARRRARK
jgi:endonuclease/exonuclease/phosphatase family metal-dependent hydrolase